MPKPRGKWQTVEVEAFDGGLNKAARPEVIPENDLLIADNVTLRQKRVLGDSGYSVFSGEVRGVPQTDYQYYRRSGTSELILITTESVYKYQSAADEWQYIPAATPTTSVGVTAAGATDIDVVDDAAFSDNDYIGIILDDGSQHKTRVNGTPVANNIVFDDPIPVGRTVPDGSAVIVAVLLAGDLDFLISIVPVPSHDWVAFTNGVDLPMRYDGTICSEIPNLPVGVTACKVMAVFNATLFLMHTTEGGLNYPQRIRRSEIGDPEAWTGGTTGYDDLYNGADFIIAAEPMGPYLIVYRERSIVRGQFINTAGKYYDWDNSVDGEGASSTQSVVNLNAEHLVFANAGIYSYTGGYELASIADKVFYLIFADEGDLNTAYRFRIFSFYVEELDEAWFFYPAGTSEFCNTLVRYNVGDGSWVRRRFNDSFIGFGFYQNITSRRWVDLVGPWTAQTWRWDSRSVSTDSPTTHLMAQGQNLVMQYDYISQDDDGVAIPVQVETKDFFNKDWAMRFDMLQVWLRGVDVLVEYSTDAGDTYNTLGTLTSTRLQIHTLSSQFVCDKIRFRFSTSEPGFELGWMKFEYLEEATTRYRNG